jgi:cytochrome b561
MAALVAVQILAGIAMTSEGFQGASDALYVTHKGTGVVLLLLLVVRVIWRVAGPAAPPLPDAIPPAEKRLAAWTHRFLYLLVGILALTGYLRTVGGGYPVELLDVLGVPPLVGENEALATRLSVAHKVLGYVLVATVALHVGAVVQHTFLIRNRVLDRMWPPWGRGGGA